MERDNVELEPGVTYEPPRMRVLAEKRYPNGTVTYAERSFFTEEEYEQELAEASMRCRRNGRA